MNKRQRKKCAKKRHAHIAQFLRSALAGVVGTPMGPKAAAAMGAAMSRFIRTKMQQPSFTHSIFLVEPHLEAPFRQWQELGSDALTHHVGNTVMAVCGDIISHQWTRFCDYVMVDPTYVLSYEAPVTCLMCLGREDKIRNTIVIRVDDRL